MMVDRVIETLTPSELDHAVEENLYALFRTMVSSLGGEVMDGEEAGRHHAFPFNPMFKGVWRTRLSYDRVDAAIDETIAWFQEREAPFFFWWTGPRTTPADLGDLLTARGFISMEEQSRELAPGIVSTAAGAPGMTANLDRLNEAVMDRSPPGLTIDEVRNDDDLDAFTGVLVDGYGIPAPVAAGWAEAARRVGIGETPWRMYLARLDGEPVATNMLFCGGGVASIYGVATLPPARGRGIGSAVSLLPLVHARTAGYRYAALFATEEGRGVYERLGFRDRGVRLNRYLWRNPG